MTESNAMASTCPSVKSRVLRRLPEYSSTQPSTTSQLPALTGASVSTSAPRFSSPSTRTVAPAAAASMSSGRPLCRQDIAAKTATSRQAAPDLRGCLFAPSVPARTCVACPGMQTPSLDPWLVRLRGAPRACPTAGSRQTHQAAVLAEPAVDCCQHLVELAGRNGVCERIWGEVGHGCWGNEPRLSC